MAAERAKERYRERALEKKDVEDIVVGVSKLALRYSSLISPRNDSNWLKSQNQSMSHT